MATEKTKRPQVELPLNIPTTLVMLKNTCYEGENAYGTYYLYSVEHEGVEKAFFASPDIHQKIVESKLIAGSAFTLTKIAAQNGKRVSSQIMFEIPMNGKAVKESLPLSKNGNGELPHDNFKQIMSQSLREAIEITKAISNVTFVNEDIQKICSCLFIARTRTA